MLKTRAKHLFLAGASRLTGRHARLLPAEAAGEGLLLQAEASYRIEGPALDVDLREPKPGRLTAELLAYDGHFPTREIWTGRGLEYPGPCQLSLDLSSGEVRLAGRLCGTAPLPIPGRRLSWRLTLEQPGGRRVRLTGHYLAASGDGDGVGREYFEGGNYVDHEAQSSGEAKTILSWLQRFEARGPVLEVGCATGGVLAALAAAGLPAFGLDLSEWAVGQARERLGAERAWVCNAETDAFPAAIEAQAPYGALVLWSVFEHFRDPFGTLARLGGLARPGTLLLLQTTNARSLTRSLFAGDWEGYFDRTHHGVDRVDVETLRRELPRLGWEIEHLHTHLLWTASADPSHATLRDWYAADARFRRLLAERDLGDLALVVARKTPEP